MGIKKYELITDGSNKRIKALRSFQVQDRYVNIGDVGGIVYDEKTLSQDGNAWIFKGNMGSPTIRISGDAIVDITEGTVSGSVKALLTIDGQSKVVGAAANLNVRTSGAAWELTPALFEQGSLAFNFGTNWQTGKTDSVNFVRLKQPIYVGAASGMSIAISVPGYTVQAYMVDRDGNFSGATSSTNSGEGVTISIPGSAVYLQMRMTKNPSAATVPADVATAKPTLSNGTVEGSFLIRDSAIIITNTSVGTAAFSITQTGPGVNGTSVLGSSIVNSTVNIYKPGNLAPSLLIATDMVNTNATITTTAATNYDLLGVYDNVKNLMVTSDLGIPRAAPGAETIITAKDCQEFAYNSTVFPGAAAAQTASRPFRFVRCNVPDGRFYDHAQILNQYTDIDFSKAVADLGKMWGGNRVMASSEVQGMYRVITTGVIGSLVESYESVKGWMITNISSTYNTTVYKDCYITGLLDVAGTNVFGRTRSHDNIEMLNAAVRAVQGMFNTTAVGGTITGVVAATDRVCIPIPFRASGSIVADIKAPSNIESYIFMTDAKDTISTTAGWVAGNRNIAPGAGYVSADKFYVAFRKAGGGNISASDLGDAAIRLYRGCKIVNTGGTTLSIKGNVRVEDDAHVLDTSITGTGYFGGFSTIQGATITGCAYMKDRAVCAIPNARTFAELRMTDNSLFIGNAADTTSNLVLSMSDNAKVYLSGRVNVLYCKIRMEGDSSITGGALVSASTGEVLMKDKASISGGSTTIMGDITLCGSYSQASGNLTWTGKRVIFDANAPTYSNNVKTQYDF